ncbi:hypothetical protein ACIA6E_08370 [Streptomyces sp. NPDC051815]|uniref:hypothetical protein n=1 Tax=Streptomyces sp. NPDC051815 TaxID=3365674 RepID=UPI00378D06C3
MNPVVLVVGGPDGYRAVTDDWGAVGLDLDLMAGPDFAHVLTGGALAYGDPLPGPGTDEDVQAGALLDPDRRVLLLFTLEGPTARMRTRRAALALLRAAWPGWDVRWAHGGRTQLRAYAGLDAADDPQRNVLPWDRNLFDAGSAGWVVPDADVTVVTVDTPGRCHLVCHAFDHPVMHGPALLGLLDTVTDHGTYHEPVAAGLHIDPERRRVGWWLTGHQVHHDTAAARWPGWTVEFWEDRWAEHRAASGGRFDPTEPDGAAALADVRDEALRHWSPVRHEPDGSVLLSRTDGASREILHGEAARRVVGEAYRAAGGG